MAPEAWEYRTWDDFERAYSAMPGPNYVWFEFKLQLLAADLYQRGGEDAIRRLFDAFRLDDDSLAALLRAHVDPALADFALTS